MPFAKVGDIDIHYEREGQGPPLLLIMGFGGQALSWGDEFISLLTPSFQVLRFDNRGTGLSDKPEMEYTMPMLADDAAGLLRAVGMERAHVFGVSMGGMVAQEMALRHPQLIHGLVLGCTWCGGPRAVAASADILAQLMPVPGLSREEQIRRSWPVVATPEFLERGRDFLEQMLVRGLENPTPIATLMRQAAAVQAFDAYERLPQIQAPTLIITGNRDLLVPPENSYILRERIPNSRLQVIAEASHVFFWEKPQEAAQAVVEFLLAVTAGTNVTARPGQGGSDAS